MRVLPLKRLVALRVSNVDKKSVCGEPPVRLCNYTDVYYREAIRPDQEFMAATASADQIRAFRLHAGDVLITKDSETADDIGVVAYVQVSAPDLLCGYHLAILRPDANLIDGRFLYWSMNSTTVRQQLAVAATGVTRYGLRTDAIGSVMLALPGPVVQRAIADFLDAETARIDTMIMGRGAMITLLKERERTYTGEFIRARSDGFVPLRRLLVEPPKYGAALAAHAGEPEWPRYIRITDLAPDGGLRHEDVQRLPLEVAHEFMLSHDDLLFARSGATAGKAMRYQRSMGAACFAGYLIRFRIDTNRALARFVELWTQTTDYWSQLTESTVQSTIQNVNAARYLDLAVPKLSVSAQSEVVRAVATVRSRNDALLLRLSRQIELLRERRQALITAAVIGELDIPGAAA